MFKIKYILFFTVSAFSAVAAAREDLSESGVFLDGVAAVVNEGVVLRSDLDRQIATIQERAANGEFELPPMDVLQEQLLERLIVEEIQLQRADRVGIQISDQMLNQAISNIAEQNGTAFEDLPALLASQGISYGEYRREMRRQMTLEQLRRIDVVQRISVSPREIEQCLEDLDENVVINSEYNLSHILISVSESATGEEFDEAESEANDVYQQLVDGANFGEMAVRHSDTDKALEGGSLGWLKGDQIPTMFVEAISPLLAGDVAPPVRAVSGYHIVRINDMRSTDQRSEIEQMNVRHILITPNEIIDDQTAKQRLDDAVEELRAGGDFSELAKLLSDDPGSTNSGGEMGWTGPGTFVPEFEKVAKESEIGNVSEPFRSRFGWHILEVMGTRMYDNTEDLRRNSCASQVRNSKVADETEIWTRRIRDEAFVNSRI
jgi:peptidyl-prolyl cis-trans isomerase SurA